MLELSIIKEHCRIDDGYTADDSLLGIYEGAALRYVETWTRRKLYETDASTGFTEDEAPLLLGDDIRAAMLLLIGHWYSNRESVVTGITAATVPFAVESLLQPYRVYDL